MTNGLYNHRQIAEMLFSVYECMVSRRDFLEKRDSMNLQPSDEEDKKTKEWERYIKKSKEMGEKIPKPIREEMSKIVVEKFNKTLTNLLSQ
ncbi:MAG: hypothetical protein ABIJ14_01095 [Nanoarchaeota archaeon]